MATAREVVGDENQLMVDAGGSDAHWQGRYTWALRCAGMLADYGVDWFEEPLRPDDLEDFIHLRAQHDDTHHRGRGSDAAPVISSLPAAGRIRYRTAGCRKSRRDQ